MSSQPNTKSNSTWRRDMRHMESTCLIGATTILPCHSLCSMYCHLWQYGSTLPIMSQGGKPTTLSSPCGSFHVHVAESLWDFFTPFSLYLQNFGRPTRKPPEFFFVQSALMDLADTTTCPVSHTPWPRPTADFGHHHYY